MKVRPLKIWIDADACPREVKEVIYKASERTRTLVCLVANSFMKTPKSKLISFVQVDKGDDVADFYIVEHVSCEDIVITADVPLAALVVEKNAIALNPRGEVYTEENVREKLSIRDFMQDLRDGGVQTGGPPPFGIKDKEQFANSFNSLLTSKSR